MKPLFATALAASLLVSGAAGAAQQQLDNAVYKYAPNVDVQTLSNTQIAALNAAVHSGDDFNAINGQVFSILK